MEGRKAYFPAIDGLRLLASLNIVLLHLASSSALDYAASWSFLVPIVKAPAFAAGLFFVLAGFLFASKFNDPDRRLPVIPFMFARIAKLYRLHFACTVLMFVVVIFKSSDYPGIPLTFADLMTSISSGLSNMMHPFRSLFLHLSLTWAFVPELGMKLNEPSWSLSAFFLCYAITPWSARMLARTQSPKVLWLFFFAVFIPGIVWGFLFDFSNNAGVLPVLGDFSNYDVRYRFFHMCPFLRVFEYLFGMILFYLHQKGQFRFLERNYVSGILQAVLLAVLYLSLYTLNSSSVAWNFVGHHLFPILIYGFLIISLTTSRGWLARFFCIRSVRAVGRASFYPYLLHLPFISIFWFLMNLNTPFGTLVFLIFVYTISTLYQQHKDRMRARAKARMQMPVSATV